MTPPLGHRRHRLRPAAAARHQRRARRAGRHHRRMDRRAHRHPTRATSPPTARPPRRWPPRRRAKALAAAGVAADQDRPDRARHRDARPDLPGQRDVGSRPRSASTIASPSTSQAVCTGFLYALVGRRQYDQGRHGRSRAGDRLGDVQPHPRLGGSRRPASCSATAPARSCSRPRTPRTRGILATRLHADGRHNDLLYVDGGAFDHRHGRQAADEGQGGLPPRRRQSRRRAAAKCSRPPATRADEIDWVVPHQANKRILDATAKKLGLDARSGDRHRRPARQHVGGVGAAGARRCGARRPYQEGRPAGARGDGRRLHLGGARSFAIDAASGVGPPNGGLHLNRSCITVFD